MDTRQILADRLTKVSPAAAIHSIFPGLTSPVPHTKSGEAPVFVTTNFWHQPETAFEEVACPVCGKLIHMRWSAWFDPHNHSLTPRGCYVCYECLSEPRKSGLRLSGYKFNSDPNQPSEELK